MLEREHFAAFFDAAHRDAGGTTGSPLRPYPWQERLLDHVLETGEWPERLVAPTGSGKTSVIDIHVFAQALAPMGDPGRPPRRLSMVVDRRVLVDDQHVYARRLAGRLEQAVDDDVLGQVRLALLRLREVGAPLDARFDDEDRAPLVVARLRGGTVPDRSWLDDPTAVAIICATPDMWGSRLLFRGYGSSRLAWPREAGLLAVDSVVVVDEAHLSRQLLTTARRVAHLVPVADRADAVVWRPLQVVETTATPTPAGTDIARRSELGVDDADLADDELRRRLTRPKPVHLVEATDWAATRATKAASAIADETVALLERSSAMRAETPGPVGCFVNSVRRAVAVAAVLGKRKIDDRELKIIVVCGQVRPADLDRLRVEYPGVLSVTGNQDVDVIISTQSLEVGVDLDLVGVVTDLASGSALAQRAGRVNRRGLRARGEVVVVLPSGAIDASSEVSITDKVRSGPYDCLDLRPALEWIKRRAADDSGLAPDSLRADPPPPARQRRELYQRPELGDVWLWSRTSDELAVEIDLTLWLADEFDLDLSAGLVVRDRMPVESAEALPLVRFLAPQDHEVFSLPLRALRDLLLDLDSGARERRDGAIAPATVVYRHGEVHVLEWSTRAGGEPSPRIRPGDVVVMDSRSQVFTHWVGDRFAPQVPTTRDELGEAPATAEEVLVPRDDDAVVALGATNVLRIEPPASRESVATGQPQPEWASPPWSALATAIGETAGDPRHVARCVRDWLSDAAVRGMLGVAAERLHRVGRRSGRGAGRIEAEAHVDASSGALVRVLARDTRKAVHDEERRQEWVPAREPVPLDVHQAAVGRRAAAVAAAVTLGDDLGQMLELAGRHHDDGKRDPRFQIRLGATEASGVLAKSGYSTSPYGVARHREDGSGLPARWRHEQLSAVLAWDAVRAAGMVDPGLVARLIGTTHGRGRPGFLHLSAELLRVEDSEVRSVACSLFDEGEWDALVERTQLDYGAWGCAYLEALLRAADGQVSMEGS